MFALHGSVPRMDDGSYAPAIIITDLTTGKQRKIKLAGHFTEKEKARNEAASARRWIGLLPEVHAWIGLLGYGNVLCAVKLKTRLPQLPGYGWEMSAPDEEYWDAARARHFLWPFSIVSTTISPAERP